MVISTNGRNEWRALLYEVIFSSLVWEHLIYGTNREDEQIDILFPFSFDLKQHPLPFGRL